MRQRLFDDDRFFDAYERWFGSIVNGVLTISARVLPTFLHSLVFRVMLKLARPFGSLVGWGYALAKRLGSSG